MDASGSSFSRDLFHGTVHGLGLAAAVWTVPDPVLLEPLCLALVGLAGVAGLVRLPLPRGGDLSLQYPFTLAVLILYGLGPAVLGAMLATLLGALADERVARDDRLRRTAFDCGRAAVSVSFAGIAYYLLGGASDGLLSFRLLHPLLAYTLAYATIDVSISLLEILAAGLRPVRGAWLATRWIAWVVGSIAAPLVVAVHQHRIGRVALVALPLFFVSYLLGRARARRTAIRPPRREGHAEIYHAISRSLAQSLAGDDARTDARRARVQKLCLDVGERLGLAGAEMEGLATAALLHDVGRIVLPDGAVDAGGSSGSRLRVHPRLGSEILAAIDFPYPTRKFVEHLHERWDGKGRPHGLQGEAIPVGSRILAAVERYETLCGKSGTVRDADRQRVRALLRADSDVRLDSLVVDRLLECVDRQAQLRSSCGPADDDDEAGQRIEPERIALEHADRELQTLYEIEHTLNLELSLRQRLTLMVAQLAELIPHEGLSVVTFTRDARRPRVRFAHGSAAESSSPGLAATAPPAPERSRLAAPLTSRAGLAGELALDRESGPEFTARERRLLTAVAGHLAAAMRRDEKCERSPGPRSLTDALTGLPNARFLRLESAHRLARPDSRFGLLALHVRGLEEIGTRHDVAVVDRLTGIVARRFASTCRRGETLVRFGTDQFVVLTSASDPGELVSRWSALSRSVEGKPLTIGPGVEERVRVACAHVMYPDDGERIDDLLGLLGRRLPAPERERTVVPFRRTVTAG